MAGSEAGAVPVSQHPQMTSENNTPKFQDQEVAARAGHSYVAFTLALYAHFPNLRITQTTSGCFGIAIHYCPRRARSLTKSSKPSEKPDLTLMKRSAHGDLNAGPPPCECDHGRRRVGCSRLTWMRIFGSGLTAPGSMESLRGSQAGSSKQAANSQGKPSCQSSFRERHVHQPYRDIRHVLLRRHLHHSNSLV